MRFEKGFWSALKYQSHLHLSAQKLHDVTVVTASVLVHLRFNKGVIHHCVLKTRNVHMAHSPAIIAVMIGLHMEPGGGVEEREKERGGRLVPHRAHQQKRAETAALSTVHTIKDLEQGSGGGEVPKTLHFKGLKVFLHLGH